VKIKILGIALALMLILVGAMWVLQGGGKLGSGAASESLQAVGSILAGFGVALGYVTLRGRQ
jgi:hypothetical protein